MPEMKDSGIEWIGEIPDSWSVIKGKYVLKYLQKPIRDDDGVITCFRDGEVTLRSNRREDGFTLSDKEIGYQGIDVGDLVVHGMDGFAGSIGISDSRGKASPVLVVLDSDNNKRFLMYYLRSTAYRDVFLALATGIRVRSCDLRWNKLAELPYLVPPIEVQNKVADFLDSKCTEIDALIADIQSQIETLEEYKKSIIFQTICHGINGDIQMKRTDSDVWSEIPVDWELKDIKYMFEIVKRIAGKEGFDVLSVTQRGLKVKDITSGDGQLADSYSGYQFVYPSDYVMNHMDLLTGWVDLSTMFGVTSPDYRVFRLRDKTNNSLDYYKYVMQCCYMNKIFYSLGQGVSNLGRWRLQTSSFNNFKVPVPPTKEQTAIADYLNYVIEETNAIIDTKKEQLETLEEYKKSVIYEYVTGKKEVPLS
ncbi:MAG: restriction endonuclease subunit S [Lachnospira sp.]